LAVYIELTTDAFAQVFTQQQGAVTPQGRAGISNARRPLRGLEIKDDTYAIIKVVTSNGTELPLIDSGAVGGTNTQYSNFILQSVQEARMEKHQIVETFGESYIFFFGESPRFLDVQAILVDSFDFNWYAEFWQNYDLYLRGSKSVEMGARTYLFYDDNIVEGYMLMASAVKVADQPLQARLTFRLFLTNYQNISLIGSDVYPVRASVSIPPDATQTAANAFDPPDSPGLGAGQGSALGVGVGGAIGGGLQASLQVQAGIGASLQVGGFGGTSLLTAALTAGVQPTGNVALYEAEQSASFRNTGAAFVIDPSLLGLSQGQAEADIQAGIEESLMPTTEPLPEIPRTLPIRSLISDNTDEFTGSTPPAPGPDDPSMSEAPDLSQTAIQQAGMYGADINDPTTFAGLGLGVNFGLGVGVGIGIGTGGGATVGASFGVTGGVGLNGVYGGINGGLGFIGGSGIGASASLSIQPNPLVSTQLAEIGIPNGTPAYGNGVQISGGVIAGTGIGGGIPGGITTDDGPLSPGTLLQYTGATAFQAQQATSQGYGANISGQGASINVGGAPSAFAMVVTTGDLLTMPTGEISFFTGPEGSSSDTNVTGLHI
jgi:hypothetical protein